MKRVEKKTKEEIAYAYDEPESVSEALGMFGEEKVLGMIRNTLARVEGDKARRPKSEALDPDMKAALKDPAVKARLKELMRQAIQG